MCLILDERGVNTCGMKADQMREILGSYPDFKTSIERFLAEDTLYTGFQSITVNLIPLSGFGRR